MKKLLRSTFGTLVVAAFLAMAPPTYARGGHGGGHGGHRGGGHGGKHVAAGHVKGGHGAFRARSGRGRQFVGPRTAAGVMQGVDITELAAVGGEVTTDIRTMDLPAIVWAIMVGLRLSELRVLRLPLRLVL